VHPPSLTGFTVGGRRRFGSLRSRIRGLLKRSRTAIVAVTLAREARLSILERVRPSRPVRLGATHHGFSLEQSVAYVEKVVGDYILYGGLTSERLEDARVLEVGPGDSLGVALWLFAKGARQVVCLDRFATWRDPDQQRRINAAIAERMCADERRRLTRVLASGGELRPGQDEVVLIEGRGIEDAAPLFGSRFHAIVSRAVLAHVWELDRAFGAMDRLLAPRGLMSHKVDLSDHGLFSDAGHHPLTFLTVPDAVWDRMRLHTGLSNRRLVNYYRGRLDELGYEAALLVTKVIGWPALSRPLPAGLLTSEFAAARPLIDEIGPRLLERYRGLDDQDLATAGIFVAAHKPA
jgi:SAM-dependent methyltransferase